MPTVSGTTGSPTNTQDSGDEIYTFNANGTITFSVGGTVEYLVVAGGGGGGIGEFDAAGTYTAGGTSIGNWGSIVTESGGTVTVDSATNPTWAQDASNDTDAYFALIYNDTQAGDPALAYVSLSGPVDMSAGSLTVTWNASGLFTITKA